VHCSVFLVKHHLL